MLGLYFFQQRLIAQNLKGLDFIIGSQTSGDNVLELGVAYGQRGDELASLFYTNFHACIETVFKENSQNVYGVKLGFSRTYAIVNFALQGAYFSNFSKGNALLFRPELGITLFGILDLNYVKSFIVNDSNPMQLAPNGFVLRFTIGKTSSSILKF